jgi:hypothetical protein
MSKQLLCKTVALCVVGLAACTSASGKTIFYDDFRDGDAADGEPVSWVPLPTTQGTYDASSGDYLLAPQIRAIGASVPKFVLHNVSIRTQLRMLTPSVSGGGVELLARLDPVASTYEGAIDEDGKVYIARTGVSLASANTDLRPLEEDVIMQFDVIGSSLSLWAWREGEKMPSAPLVTATDSRYFLGQTGVYYFANEANSTLGSAIFRYVHVADMHIPEPSTAVLAVLGLTCACLRRRRAKEVSQG